MAFVTKNPAYAALTIAQKPLWVWDPTTYAIGAISSLSVSFEDPDSTSAQALLRHRTRVGSTPLPNVPPAPNLHPQTPQPQLSGEIPCLSHSPNLLFTPPQWTSARCHPNNMRHTLRKKPGPNTGAEEGPQCNTPIPT